jgi:hypothetical protein
MYASSFVAPSPSPQPHSFPRHHHPPSRRRPIPSCFRCCRSIRLSRRRPFHRSLSPLSSFHRSLPFTAPLCSPLPSFPYNPPHPPPHFKSKKRDATTLLTQGAPRCHRGRGLYQDHLDQLTIPGPRVDAVIIFVFASNTYFTLNKFLELLILL